MHNWSLPSFSQDYELASPTTYVVCDNFINELRGQQFEVDSELQTFGRLFMAILFTLRVFCQKSVERKSPKKYLHTFLCLACGLNSGLTPYKPSRYLLDYGDF